MHVVIAIAVSQSDGSWGLSCTAIRRYDLLGDPRTHETMEVSLDGQYFTSSGFTVGNADFGLIVSVELFKIRCWCSEEIRQFSYAVVFFCFALCAACVIVVYIC